jgi:hypothetical protein
VTGKIILLEDIYEIRKRKEQELQFYHNELEKLRNKLFFVQKEIDLTNYIIDIIEQEKVVDVKQLIKEKDSEK